MPKINVVSPSGRTIAVEADQLPKYKDAGWHEQDAGERVEQGSKEMEDKLYEGGGARAFGHALESGATFGLSDLGGTDAYNAYERENREHHPGLTAAGEAVGNIASTVLGLPGPGTVGHIAEGAAERIGEHTVAQRLLAKAAESAITSGAWASGHALSEAALSNEPINVQKIAAQIATNTALGTGLGVTFGAAQEFGRVIRRASAGKANPLLGSDLDKLSERFSGELESANDGIPLLAESEYKLVPGVRRAAAGKAGEFYAHGQVASALGLEEAPPPGEALRQVALEAAAQAEGRAASEVPTMAERLSGDVSSARKALKDAYASPHTTPEELSRLTDTYTNELHGSLTENNRLLGKVRARLAGQPPEVVEAEQAQANLRQSFPKFKVDLQKLSRQSPDKALAAAKSIDEFSRVLAKTSPDARLLDEAALVQHLTDGASPELQQAFEQLDTLKDPQKLGAVFGVDPSELPTSPAGNLLLRIYAVNRAAREAAVEEPGLMGHIASGVGDHVRRRIIRAGTAWAAHAMGAPFPVTMLLAVGLGRLTKRMGSAIGAALEGTGKVLGSRPALIGELEGINFGGSSKSKNIAKRRVEDLSELMARPGRVEELLDSRTAALRAAHPELGQAVKQNLSARLSYYYQTAPKAPLPSSPLAPIHWEPSPAEADEWAQRIRAGEDPLSLLDDIKHGQLHPAAIETVETLYPDLYQEMQQKILERLPEYGELPYQTRLQLSLLYNVPVEPTMDPVLIGSIQALYQQKAQAKLQQKPAPVAGNRVPAPGATKGQTLEAR